MNKINLGLIFAMLIITALALIMPANASENITNSYGIIGDINNDEKIDSIDYMLLRREVLCRTDNILYGECPACYGTTAHYLSDEQLLRANTFVDALINSVDSMFLLRYIMGQETGFTMIGELANPNSVYPFVVPIVV